jgi:DNA modification methylase
VASVKLNRKFLGYEIHPPYFKEAVRRIESAEGEFGKDSEGDEDAA